MSSVLPGNFVSTKAGQIGLTRALALGRSAVGPGDEMAYPLVHAGAETDARPAAEFAVSHIPGARNVAGKPGTAAISLGSSNTGVCIVPTHQFGTAPHPDFVPSGRAPVRPPGRRMRGPS